MIEIILSQLWWFMPLFAGLLYFAIGFVVCKSLIRSELVQSVSDWWLYFILWLPLFVLGGLISSVRWLSQFPRRIAESQLNK